MSKKRICNHVKYSYLLLKQTPIQLISAKDYLMSDEVLNSSVENVI